MSPPRSEPTAAVESNTLQRSLKLIVASLVILGLYFGREILVPFALAILASFVLDPIVSRLRRWHLPRGLAVAVVMLFATVTLAGAALFAGRQIVLLGQDLPTYQTTIQHKLRDLRLVLTRRGPLDQAARAIDAVETELDATWHALEQRMGARQRAPMRVEVADEATSPLQALQDALGPVLTPLATFGLVLVFTIFILLERAELRDRFLRLLDGDLYRSTEAVNEAGQRVSRYLTMQLLVNVGFGVPMTIGLWLIGVPGALLWGCLATVLRFVPYLGPVISGAFPLLMAFAVDPGWSMLGWTLALIVGLELISNNLIEPWLYGGSTGLAPVAVLLSASFWTLLWGISGLVLATPLTVCLVVLGRHLPALNFIDVLFGNAPVFDTPTRLYQRLIAGKLEEAAELAEDTIVASSLPGFYANTAIPALRVASEHGVHLNPAQRQHFYSGLRVLMRHAWRASAGGEASPVYDAPVMCIGVRWEADVLGAEMLQQSLVLGDIPARLGARSGALAEHTGELDLTGARVICLCAFNAAPQLQVRQLCRLLRQRDPQLQIVALLANVTADVVSREMTDELGANALVTSLEEACLQVVSRLAALPAEAAKDDQLITAPRPTS